MQKSWGIRAKVEYPFHVVKNLFMHRKTSYKGMAKNNGKMFSLFGPANLLLARRWLCSSDNKFASERQELAQLKPEYGKFNPIFPNCSLSPWCK